MKTCASSATQISKEQSVFNVFNVMLEAIKKSIRDFGRPLKLSRADYLLMTLMYWREYRTEFHIGVSYGISESATCRTIKKIEDALIESEILDLLHKS